MRNLLTLLFIFLISISLSQEKRTVINGKVTFDKHSVSDVHVLNTTTNMGSITNSAGVFKIQVKDGDHLYFSHLNLEERLILISKELISENQITIFLREKTYVLDEISLNTRSIFYVDKDIMPHNLPIINSKTLNLPYANSNKTKDNSLTNITFTSLSVNLENLVSSLNGKARRQKKAKELQLDDVNLKKIRNLFTDYFFVTNLKIKKAYINQFLNFCKKKGLLSVFKTKNSIELTEFLLIESEKFPNQAKNTTNYVTN
jgi:hypothetical protein